jgi:4a-hydroxytetrahydrobiopterin dehydratase
VPIIADCRSSGGAWHSTSMPAATPRLLDDEEIDRQLSDLPGWHRGAAGTLVHAVRAPSFEEAVQLVQLVAEDAELMNHHPDIDLRWTSVSFTLFTHSAGGLTQLDVELAHQINQASASVGASNLPAPERIEVALDVVDADAVREFWRVGLGYVERSAPSPEETELHAGDGRGPVVWFQQLAADDPRRQVRSRVHLDVYVPDDVAQARVTACLDGGGRLVDASHAPSWWVLADPEGNELCICTRAPEHG